MKLILLGAPGAGKGTQAEIICDKYHIPALSTGNILREAIKNGTETGLKAKSYMDAGTLVPDDVIIGVIRERMQQPDAANGFILDGVPRTLAQAEALETMGVEIDRVLNIHVADEDIVRRLSGRRVCESCGSSYHTIYNPSEKPEECDRCSGRLIIRKDDEVEIILDRLAVYRKETKPLMEFYRQRGKLVEVEGAEELSETTARVQKALEDLR